MNDNDIADQLRLVYHIMRFQQNEKWWWALFIWGFEVSLVNAFMLMRRYCELKGVPVCYNHHHFNEKVGLAYLDPNKYWPSKKSPQQLSPASANNNKSHWAKRFNTKALCPITGRLKIWLNNTAIHMPTVPAKDKKGNANCQLYRWASSVATGKGRSCPPGAQTQVMLCKTCWVHLCLCCWEIYHTEENLELRINDILSFT